MPDPSDRNDDASAPTTADDAPPQLTPIGSFTTWFSDAIKRVPSTEEHDAIDELIPQGGPEFVEYVVRFSLLIMMSASIAAIGSICAPVVSPGSLPRLPFLKSHS